MTTPKRPGSMSDDARALSGAQRRRTPPGGWPVHVDEETTPPPQEPPIGASLDDLRATVAEIARGMERVWPARDNGDQLSRLDAKLDRLHVDAAETGALLREFLMPAIKATMGNVDLLLQHHEANKVRQAQFYDREWPAASKKIDDLGDRISRLERSVDRGIEQHEALSDRVDDVARRSHSASERLRAVETTSAVTRALTTKQKVGLGGLAGAAGVIAGLLKEWLM